MKSLIEFKNVTKEYRIGEQIIRALDEISFEIKAGEFVVILGPSGAGKSTLLNLLGGMDSATSGSIYVDGLDLTGLNDRQMTAYRRRNVGFIFQFYNLIPTLTAWENVALIKEVSKNSLEPGEILKKVGLGERLNLFPAQLSGGEQQRVSIARALCKNPKLLLCDEPTGALDSETGVVILDLLQKMSAKEGHTVVVVTHNTLMAPLADRVIRLRNGRIKDIFCNERVLEASEVNW